MNPEINTKKSHGIRELDNEFKEKIIKEDNTFREILIDKLKRNSTWKNIKRSIQNYIKGTFTGVEEDVIKYIISEMKGSFRKYGVLDVRGYGDKYVIAYPIYKMSYTLTNKVTYRIVALLSEYGKAYSVLNSHRITIDLSKGFTSYRNSVYDYFEVSNGIYNMLDTILNYHYEIVDKDAYVVLDELGDRIRIRAQGDLVLDYELMDKYMLESYIKSSLKDVLGLMYANDLVRYISRKLNLHRIEHGVEFQDRRVFISIPVSKGDGNYVYRLMFAIEKLLSGEIGLSKSGTVWDYDLRTTYRCPYGSGACEYVIRLDLVPYRLVDILNSNDIIAELAESVMVPKRHVLNIGNHNVNFIAYDNMVHIDLNMPFTGDTIRQYVRWTTDWYYIEPGVYDIEVAHNEHGDNRLKIESEDYIAFRWLTIEKPRVHELLRNKIALRRFVSKYA